MNSVLLTRWSNLALYVMVHVVKRKHEMKWNLRHTGIFSWGRQ